LYRDREGGEILAVSQPALEQGGAVGEVLLAGDQLAGATEGACATEATGTRGSLTANCSRICHCHPARTRARPRNSSAGWPRSGPGCTCSCFP
jgi:hypothetical protein